MKEYLYFFLLFALGMLFALKVLHSILGLARGRRARRRGSRQYTFDDDYPHRHRIDPKMDIRSFSGDTSSKAEKKDGGKSKDGDSVDPKK